MSPHPTTTTRTTLPIALAGVETTTVSALPAAIERRDALLTLSRKGQRIASAERATRATQVLRDLKEFASTVEAGRKAAKTPVLDLGKRIDALATDLTADIEAEARRIGRLIGAWNAEQERIADEARRRAEEEARRVREEAERVSREARRFASRCTSWGIGWCAVGVGVLVSLLAAACQMGGGL